MAAANVPAAAFFKPKTDENRVVTAFVNLAARLGRWPTENHQTVERQRDNSFPSLKVVRRLSRSGALANLVAAHCANNPSLAHVGAMAAEKLAEPVSSPTAVRAHIEGYVYLMKTGRRYKIGHTTSPSRRHREVRLDLPEPTDLVHTIPTDDPPGIEEYWHRRFKGKRIRDTEFFELDRADVIAFQARKYQ